MGNQKGEVATGAMVVVMVVMMLFGGMHLMHGNHRHDEKSHKDEHKNDHQHGQEKEGMRHTHNDGGEHSHAQEEGK